MSSLIHDLYGVASTLKVAPHWSQLRPSEGSDDSSNPKHRNRRRWTLISNKSPARRLPDAFGCVTNSRVPTFLLSSSLFWIVQRRIQ